MFQNSKVIIMLLEASYNHSLGSGAIEPVVLKNLALIYSV
jgi:hypothetical protein